ncbi:hypothetical protein DS2_02885 [Catenovulum agarivorans DS-2]|uniref:DUF5060 domain-containing protein n=1 Tax=Catenovulum agarivorans DS-2 TaxID=1328313 RepID=W7QFP0_9ALTE|nr:DUF5060 domain-containing protein [Catenovulum agarivorans]EWH11734.1 hypothetical protein DS2_02885 [Catenovulum agarivorans DS-2]
MNSQNLYKYALGSILLMLLAACQPYDNSHKIAVMETFTLNVEGPMTNEQAQINPFTDYLLLAHFELNGISKTVRGFYAADGKAANTSAESGNIWQVNFTPEQAGDWQYRLEFKHGKNIAINPNIVDAELIQLQHESGVIEVIENNQHTIASDFLTVKNGYYYQRNNQQFVLKMGANSPETLFAYADFDNTYRAQRPVKNPEKNDTAYNTQLHEYLPHIADWQEGDPTWQRGKGKGLIGAINYLASTGMNSIYFITMNITGDGNDVWPYTDHQTFDRFDVSKLAQWDIVFAHMRNKGMIAHIILQETENELLLDNGDTQRLRKLYLQELVARFAHHSNILWNIGEENGPVGFSPNGQSPEQVKAMVDYLTAIDPYQHPIIIHSHASNKHKHETLTGLLGHKNLLGLSFQVDQPARVGKEIAEWRQKSRQAGHMWTISMDEIGIWHTGAKPDADDPEHNIMRQQVLWPSLMQQASGVEWYFGYNYAHNDLNAEDWRSRDNLWQQTQVARELFEQAGGYSLTSNCAAKNLAYYCLTDGKRALYYFPSFDSALIEQLPIAAQAKQTWFNPKSGNVVAEPALLTSQNDWLLLVE